jgi:DnaJ family protein C protein 28
VEDLIQESMQRGEFNNLPGCGKPLKYDITKHNPYVDTMTHKLNEILIQNGFVPEWVLCEKELRQELGELRENIRECLQQQRHTGEKYKVKVQQWMDSVKDLNKRIDRFNLLVPILNKQQYHINLEREIEKIKQKLNVSNENV